jgi:hypothetical protein
MQSFSGAELEAGLRLPAAVQTTVIIANAFVRIAAIAAGVYIAKLGHDTILKDAQGQFEYEGALGKMKAQVPGPAFVLFGAGVIGWALATPVEGSLDVLALSELPPSLGGEIDPSGTNGSGIVSDPPPFGRPE